MLLNIVIPLWLIEETDPRGCCWPFCSAPTRVMCIFLPMAASRGVHDVPTALRAVRLGHVTVTGAELYLSAASWTFEAS